MTILSSPGVPIRLLETQVPVFNLAGAKGSALYFKVEVPGDRHILDIRIFGGSGDADLYVRRGALPTKQVYDARPAKNGNDEAVRLQSFGTCLLNNPWSTARVPQVVTNSGLWSFLVGGVAVDYYIMLYGYAAYRGVTLAATHR